MEIKKQLEKYRSAGLKIFASSSFQTQSVPLLHLLSIADRSIPIYFLNTGFHFSESLLFKEEITQLLGLNVVDIKSDVPKIQQRDGNGRMLYTSDPDYCCYLNKVQPMEPVLKEFDVWISGVRADQSTNRKKMGKEANAQFGTLRYHPMLEWTSKMVYDYIREHKLPKHPLDEKGYFSIGCQPCTIKMEMDLEDGRNARWFGMNKTECGIHTDLVKG